MRSSDGEQGERMAPMTIGSPKAGQTVGTRTSLTRWLNGGGAHHAQGR